MDKTPRTLQQICDDDKVENPGFKLYELSSGEIYCNVKLTSGDVVCDYRGKEPCSNSLYRCYSKKAKYKMVAFMSEHRN